MSFTGIGYHDNAWGDELSQVVKSWCWGHAQLGPYTLVWWIIISTEPREYVSGYVARNGKILKAGCESGAVKVRPYGQNSTYPPSPFRVTSQGFRLSLISATRKTCCGYYRRS